MSGASSVTTLAVTRGWKRWALALTAAIAVLAAGAPAGAASQAGSTRSSSASCAGARHGGLGPAASARIAERATSVGGAPVVLPRDEAPHSAPTEWWYFSGHLWGVDRAGRLHCYGFEYVTFQFLVGPTPVYVGNFAVTDLNRRTFRYAAQQDAYALPKTPGSFALHTGDWTMKGHAGRDHLHADLQGYRLDLTLQTTKPPVIHGTDGVIGFGPFGSSRYYSWTSLLAGGTIIDHGLTVPVLGQSWMDHQWGAFDFASGGGWDWFSLQLSTGQQYMLYFIRNRSGRVVQTGGTRVGLDGRSMDLSPGTFGERAAGSWHSDVTGITYSSGWRLQVPHGRLTVSPDLRNQELDLRRIQGVAYWEGAVTVRGGIGGAAVTGVGYTEINPVNQP